MRDAVNQGRYISATETQVHSVLEILPLTAALMVILSDSDSRWSAPGPSTRTFPLR